MKGRLFVAFLFVMCFCFCGSEIVTTPDSDYDYIIVGGGSAGGVLSFRLSADSSKKVLLVDAGDVPWDNSSIPGFVATLQNSPLDFAFRTVPQKTACKANKDQISAWPRGKCLGGSSILNYMQYHRGAPADYDYWATLLGKSTQQWGYEGLLPYFKKSEKAFMRFKNPENDDDHGHDGPVKTNFATRAKYSQEFLKAAKQAGFRVDDDYNNHEGNEGFAPLETNVYKGVRQSTYEVFIKPALSRQNFHVLTNAIVTKVLFAGKTAVGLQYAVNGSKEVKTLKTTGKIILSSGAIGSPQILLNSGVGPKSELEDLSINVVMDHPNVGKNLLDHIFSDITFVYNQNIGIDTIALATSAGLEAAVKEYQTNKTGPLANTILDVNGRFTSPTVADPGKRPNIQFIIAPTAAFSTASAPSMTNMKPEFAELAYGQANVYPSSTVAPILAQPHSVGEIKLKSSDPFERPLIDPKYLSNPKDVDILLDAYKLLRKVAQQPALKKYDFRVGEGAIQACLPNGDNTPKNLTLADLTDEYLRCHVAHRTLTVYHPVCTCRMGKTIKESVVDAKFRVHGLHRLYVADASVFPAMVSGNTNAPSMMIGEKAADVIQRSKLAKNENDTPDFPAFPGFPSFPSF